MGEHTDKTKGKFKKAAGDLTGDEKLQREGERDKAKGRVKGGVNDAKDGVQDMKRSAKS